MDRLIYSLSDGTLHIVSPVPKEKVEEILGKLTDEEYEKHVMERSLPSNAINVRNIKDEDIPKSREFRNAWCDVLPGTQIDIHHGKARDMQLIRLREERDKKLKETDILMTRALEDGNQDAIAKLKIKRQALRDATEPLKALQLDGYNDEKVLQQIKDLGIVKE